MQFPDLKSLLSGLSIHIQCSICQFDLLARFHRLQLSDARPWQFNRFTSFLYQNVNPLTMLLLCLSHSPNEFLHSIGRLSNDTHHTLWSNTSRTTFYMYIYVYVYVYVYICKCMCIYVYIYAYTCECIYIYIYIYMYVCVYMYIHTRMYIYIYTYIYIYIHVHFYI